MKECNRVYKKEIRKNPMDRHLQTSFVDGGSSIGAFTYVFLYVSLCPRIPPIPKAVQPHHNPNQQSGVAQETLACERWFALQEGG